MKINQPGGARSRLHAAHAGRFYSYNAKTG